MKNIKEVLAQKFPLLTTIKIHGLIVSAYLSAMVYSSIHGGL